MLSGKSGQSAEFLVAHANVKAGRLEAESVDEGVPAAADAGLGFGSKHEATVNPLAPVLLVHPKMRDMQVVPIGVRRHAADDASVRVTRKDTQAAHVALDECRVERAHLRNDEVSLVLIRMFGDFNAHIAQLAIPATALASASSGMPCALRFSIRRAIGAGSSFSRSARNPCPI